MGITAASAAAMSVFRSSTVHRAAARLASQAKSAPSSAFRLPSRTPLLAHRIFQSRAELSALNAAIPQTHCLSFDDVDAHNLSMRLWFGP